jgi:hypothetical protein
MGSPSSSFANQKRLQVTITLGGANTFSSGKNSLTILGLRASVNIDMGGGYMGGTLRARIFGLSQSDMNTMTYLAWMPQPQLGPPNKITVNAIDGEQSTLVFTGLIVQAFGNYQAMPEVFIDIQATATQAAQLLPVSPLSIASNTTVATVMGQLAKQMGFAFENNGVNVTIPKGTYQGNTAFFQTQSLMQAYNFEIYIDKGILAICPRGVARITPLVPLISPETGLIGYPYFNMMGLVFDTIFNPNILFGGTVQIQSTVTPANGAWQVINISHTLECVIPGGRWQSTVNCNKTGVAGAAA